MPIFIVNYFLSDNFDKGMAPHRICKFFLEDYSFLDMPWLGQPLANMQHYALKFSKKYAPYVFHPCYNSFALKATYFRS